MFKRVLVLVVVFISIMSMQTYAEGGISNRFTDITEGHWSEVVVHRLRDLGITNGDNTDPYEFGLGKEITRAQFITFLVRLKTEYGDWEYVTPETASYSDVNTNDWFFANIETALSKGVIDLSNQNFRPKEAITREEMTIMIVNTLGYAYLAELRNDEVSSFSDVTEHIGYIDLLRGFQIVNGKSATEFAPKETATREEAAAILIRMYDKTKATISNRNAVYAESSYSQMNELTRFDSVSFGWSKLIYNEGSQTFQLEDNKPQGYEEPLNYAKDNSVSARLSILASDANKITSEEVGLLTKFLSDESAQETIITSIINELEGPLDYDGIVIDFEDMYPSDLQEPYNSFLTKLDNRLEGSDKTLTVMVQPSLNYSGYDFKTIGQVADQVIIMAHDYATLQLTEEEQNAGYVLTPMTPIEQVYQTLLALTDKETGVEDRSKISMQVSFDSRQWGTKEDKSVEKQSAYRPSYDMIYDRLIKDSTFLEYNVNTQSPKATYYKESEDLLYVIWYEDERSIQAKVDMAKMFDIEQVSVWRLGNIPEYEDVGEKEVWMRVLELLAPQ